MTTAEYVKQIVDQAPPLTEEQLAQLRAIVQDATATTKRNDRPSSKAVASVEDTDATSVRAT